MAYGDHGRQAPLPQISGYHHQQRGFADRRRESFDNNNGNSGSYQRRTSFDGQRRWQDSTNRYVRVVIIAT